MLYRRGAAFFEPQKCAWSAYYRRALPGSTLVVGASLAGRQLSGIYLRNLEVQDVGFERFMYEYYQEPALPPCRLMQRPLPDVDFRITSERTIRANPTLVSCTWILFNLFFIFINLQHRYITVSTKSQSGMLETDGEKREFQTPGLGQQGHLGIQAH